MAGGRKGRGEVQSQPPQEHGTWGRVRPWIGTVARLLLAAVWIWAAVSKLSAPEAFVRAVRAYDVVPEWLAKAIGYGLPFVEISLGVLLVVGIGTRLVAAISGLLMVAFLIGIIQASARGLSIECGCFGGGGSLQAGRNTAYTSDILRDIGLLIVATFLVIWPATRYDADNYVRAAGAPDRRSTRVGPRRTKEAQRRLAELRAKRAKEARQRILIASSAVAVLLVAVGFAGIGVQSHRAAIRASTMPPTIASDSGYLVGNKNAKVTVDLYEDFICPICHDFENADGATIQKLEKSGKANFRYHPLGFLDANSSPAGYSSRAANAAACMPSIKAFSKFHDLLYKHQPQEGSAGLSNKQLISYGKQAGADQDTMTTCVNTRQYKGWVAKITDQASKDGVSGTPTVRIGGKDVTDSNGGVPSAATLEKAVNAAASA